MRFEYNTSACDSSCLIFGRTVSACIRSISLAFRKQRPNQLRDPKRGPLRFQKCRFFASLKASASNLKRCSPCQLFKFESHSYCKALPSNKHFHLQIIQIIAVCKKFESLGKSNIEGIEILARQFCTLSMNLKRKQYDMLAPRTAEFDTDFAKFMVQISHIEVCLNFCHLWCTQLFLSLICFSVVSNVDSHIQILAYLQNELQAFMRSCFSKIISSQQALCLIQRSV